MWVKHLESAVTDIKLLIDEHEAMAEEMMKKMPVRKATKMTGRVVLATHTKPPSKHIPFQGVYLLESSELLTNRSVNVTSAKVPSVQFQGLDVRSWSADNTG